MAYLDCSLSKNKKKILQIISRLKEGVEIAKELQIRNLLYNEAYVDLLIAVCLGHKYNLKTQETVTPLMEKVIPLNTNALLKRMEATLGRFNFTGYPKKK